MNCCQCRGIETFFNKNVAAKELKHYRKKGPGKTTRMLINALKAEGVRGMTLLDIGGGIGTIQHELLDAGVSNATSIDASTAYIESSKEEAERKGYADRLSYKYGDFVEIAPDIGQFDIVTLDRVVCCYHDVQALVGSSSERAAKLYGLVYPRDTRWVKIGSKILNFFLRIARSDFRTFVHATDAVDAVVRGNGMKQHYYYNTAIWQIVVYVK